MPKHFLLPVLMALFPYLALSQICIGGHIAPYDSITNTWLATVPESMFGHDGQLTVEMGQLYRQMEIDGHLLPSGNCQHTFQQISADNIYQALVTDTMGHTKAGKIQFTFLPIVLLNGDFGYDYQEGTLTLASPDLRADSLYSARIKWRGGVTNTEGKHKRNYKVKTDHDVSFFGMRSDNSWMLDAGQPDVFRMRNRIAMDLWNDMARLPYYADKKPKARNGVSGRMVEVFLGNEYRGVYNFSEMMDRKQLKLRKTDEATGDIHGCLYKGVDWNHTQMFDLLQGYDNTKDTFLGYEMKYPDLDDCDSTDWAPLAEANNYALQCSDLDFEEHISDYFDIPVLIDYSLFVSIVNAVDNSGKNMYWAVYDKSESKRLTLAPWDLDATFGQRWGGQLVNGKEDFSSPQYLTDVDVFVFYRLYKTNTLNFNSLLNQRFDELHQTGGVLSADSIISRFAHYYMDVKKSGAARREAEKWSGDSDVWGDTIDFDAEYEYICRWIRQHLEEIERTGFPLYYNASFFGEQMGISETSMHRYPRAVYDLKGRKVAPSGQRLYKLKPGIYIQGGRKRVKS